MFNVIIKTADKEIHKSFKDKMLLSGILEAAGLIVNSPCGGRGTCYKCKVTAQGGLSEVTETEKKHLSPEELKSDVRLACRTFVLSDCIIYYNTGSSNIQSSLSGNMPELEIDPITDNRDCHAAAIDIGTTTIVAYIYKLPEGRLVKSTCVPNLQAQYGADVISRITFSNDGGLEKLQSCVRNQIELLESELEGKLDSLVVTGNTTMLHLFTGLDPKGIALAPFIPKSLFGDWFGRCYLPRCISAYVGADITTAILASGMMRHKTAFLVDIGTNGEMALWHEGKISCCATAAGPAFEGASISRGMLAVDGAIDKVTVDNKYTTINNCDPAGICGSGLIDAIAVMLMQGVIDETGYLEADFEIGDSGIKITQNDVRMIQLAKSAIRSGIDVLLGEAGVKYEELDAFYIAGGFGSFINPVNSSVIGLIPTEVVGKAVRSGNLAGMGAAMMLLNKNCINQATEIAAFARAIELSELPQFTDKYMENMYFADS